MKQQRLQNGSAEQSFGVESAAEEKISVDEHTPILMQATTDGRPADAAPDTGTHRVLAVTCICSWCVASIGLVLMNKYLLSNYGFRRPVFLTLCHMVACMVMSWLASYAKLTPVQGITSRAQLLKVSMLALVFSIAVVLGNVALRFIPVSFSEAIGATTPAFTAVMAFLLVGTVESWATYATLIPIMVGIVLATGAEPSFNMAGFLAGVTATAARALKSVMQGILLTDEADKMDSMNLLRWMAPISLLFLIPGTTILEPGVWGEAWNQCITQPHFIVFLSVNAAMAYFVNLSNFLVTRYTSALTLQVLGNAKGVLGVVLSVLLFRNAVTFVGALGYLITVGGVVLYAVEKRRSQRNAAAESIASSAPFQKGSV